MEQIPLPMQIDSSTRRSRAAEEFRKFSFLLRLELEREEKKNRELQKQFLLQWVRK